MLMSRTYRRQAQTLTDLQIRSSVNRNERSLAGNGGAATSRNSVSSGKQPLKRENY
jgi:hypothetical protein